MSFCLRCGKQLPDDAKFCSECGTPVGSTKSGYESNRQHAYAGKVIKCPSCGTEIHSFTAICPGCGHEINSSHVSASLNVFIEKLDELDQRIATAPKAAKKGWASWKGGQRFWWIVLNIFTYCIPLVIYLILPLLKFNRTPKLTTEEEQKASFIENYPFANEREAILEALLFIESKVAFLASHQMDRKVAYWSRLWTTKAKQLYRKASMMLQGDKIAEDAYSDILDHSKQIKKIFKRRAVIGGVILIISGTLICIPRVFPQLNPLDMVSTITSNADSVWPTSGAAASLPVPSGKNVTIIENSSTMFEAEIDGQSSTEFRIYVGKCKENGFNLEIKEDYYADLPYSSSTWADFSAYNADGYWLVLNDSFSTEVRLYAPESTQDIAWDDLFLRNELPRTTSNIGIVDANTDQQLTIRISDISLNDYQQYQNACKDMGYTIDAEETAQSFSAYGSTGYKIQLTYESDVHRITISVTAPREMADIKWPNSSIVKLIPKPSSLYGDIRYDKSDYFSVYIGNISKEIFQAYVDDCIDKGFDVDYERYDASFYGDNKKGYSLTVKYKGGGVMYIEISAPD